MKETMNSRERVIRAIEHKPVDRVPIDIGMHFSSGISAFAYHNLREYLGLDTNHIEVADMIQLLAKIDEDILEMFHSDCILLYPKWHQRQVWNPRGKYRFLIPAHANPTLTDSGEWIMEHKGYTLRMPPNGFFFDGGWPQFHMDDPDTLLDRYAAEAERIYKETNYFTVYQSFGAFFSSDIDYLCDMLIDPDKIHALHKSWLESQIKSAEKVIKKLGHYIQGIMLNSDLGTQKGPFCNPKVYEELCAPYLKEFCKFLHENSDYKLILHTCGSIEPMIPILIDCGIDAINPVQISADNMDPQMLKDKYGSRMAFSGGGCNTQGVLGVGTVEEVRANVRELMGIFKENSGFIFNQVHNIMGNVPPENIIAMYDEAYKNSFYPEGQE